MAFNTSDKTDKVRELLNKYGSSYKEKGRTFQQVECPLCGNSDKFSILKVNGFTVCYRGSCSYGKKPFPDWIALTANIPVAQARREFYSTEWIPTAGNIEINFDDDFELEPEISPITYPTLDMVKIFPNIPSEGADYLVSRGIHPTLAFSYGICYSQSARRVYFPIYMDGKCYGYQGRAIDKVENGFRMRNNEGFRRELLVMFLDRIQVGGHAIIAEGPIDALKFHLCGGNTASLGKVVTDPQIDLILDKKPSAIYLALDEDAEAEMENLKDRLYGVDIYRINLPDSVKARCEAKDKKADYGECTLEECHEAFKRAIKINRNHISIKFN